MNSNRNILIVFSIVSIMLIVFGCKKNIEPPQKDNQPPTIKIVKPDSEFIEYDTVLSIVLAPFDEEDKIDKVILIINETPAKYFYSPPYQYDLKLNNGGVYHIKAVVIADKHSVAIDEITVHVEDFRTKFTGNFSFKVEEESWALGSPTTRTTTYYDGVIRPYQLIDSETDLYFYNNDKEEDPIEKVTIEFKQNSSITSIINQSGNLIEKSGGHYRHRGGFVHPDTIQFYLDGLGGLGGGSNYAIVGVRKP